MKSYIDSLNEAQKLAVVTLEGPVLVIAGAGSGKTRTIVHRLAHLIETGVPASSILLLTFTKKVATEMIFRATHLLGQSIGNIQGGTFHSFAYSLLRQFHPYVQEGKNLTVMDTSDSVHALQFLKDSYSLGKGERSFPKNQTILSYISKARNKEKSIDEILKREAYHLIHYTDAIHTLAEGYAQYKKEHALLDYDDLLFVLEELLINDPILRTKLQERYKYIMVDEYQDTNPIQARLVKHIVGTTGNIMVVGDDAQSIYAFRGADIANILRFPEQYPNTTIIKLEQNYRSIQPILDITNSILDNAQHAYQKRLITERTGTELPILIRTRTDISQSESVASTVLSLLKTYPPNEIAILFRAGYQSYSVEMQLNKLAIPFKKYGGSTYTEASHIKDIMAFLRLIINPKDYPAFNRIAGLCRGIGEKTARKLYTAVVEEDTVQTQKMFTKYPEVAYLLRTVEVLRDVTLSPSKVLQSVFEVYQPILETVYADDWVRRVHGLEQIEQMASVYKDLQLFISDISLHEMKEDDVDNADTITLSTVHSAKGLEWGAVILIDLVEERFPSKQSLLNVDDFEEERRLMYVACTRAKDTLYLFAPSQIYYKERGATVPVTLSPFIRELSENLYIEQKENYTGYFSQHTFVASQKTTLSILEDEIEPLPTLSKGYCYHKQFGKGKILEELADNKIRIDFANFGIKTIIQDYLTFNEE